MILHEDFLDFLRALQTNGVEFVVVGSFALAFHGQPRATGDMDIWIRPVPENAAALLRALHAFGFAELALSVAEILDGDVIQLGYPPVRIDILTQLDGLTDAEIWDSKTAGRLDDLSVFFLGREAYKKNKRTLGRNKDLADLDLLGE